MIKRRFLILILLFCTSICYAADKAVKDMTEDTSPLSTDIVYVVHDPGGSPVDRKVTLGNFGKSIYAPIGSHYLTDRADSTLTGEVNLGALSTGPLKITVTGNVAVPSIAAYSDITGLWTTCSGYLKSDGTCDTPGDITSVGNCMTGACDGTTMTWGDGTGPVVWTFGVTGTDPVWTASDGVMDLTTGTLKQGGAAVLNAESDPNAILKSVIVAAGDVVVGSGASAATVISKGANNSFFGVNNAGTLGFHTNITPILTAAPSSDDTYSGTIITLVAGHDLAQWDVVYCKDKAGVHACYKYDADGADKALPPRFMATATISADASGVFLVKGTVRNDGWSQTTGQDEGKVVYGSTTAGGITLTEPATDGVAVGYVVEENVIYFNPGLFGSSTGSGQLVKATSPTLVTPNIGVATGTSLALTGDLSGNIPTTLDTAATVALTAADCRGGMRVNNDADVIDYTLPPAAVGLSVCFYGIAAGVITIDPYDGTDTIYLNGTSVGAGDAIDSPGAAGDFICLMALDDTRWITLGRSGTWVDGGVD